MAKVLKPKAVGFSTRLSPTDAARVRAIAAERDWTSAKTVQKLVVAALDAKVFDGLKQRGKAA